MLHADNVTFDPECGNKHYYINDKRIEFGIIVEAIERLLNALKFKCKIQTPQVCTGVCLVSIPASCVGQTAAHKYRPINLSTSSPSLNQPLILKAMYFRWIQITLNGILMNV